MDLLETFYISTFCISQIQCDQIWRFIAHWQLFKARGNNYAAQIAHIVRQF